MFYLKRMQDCIKKGIDLGLEEKNGVRIRGKRASRKGKSEGVEIGWWEEGWKEGR